MAAADPNAQSALVTIGATLEDFNERFKKKDVEIEALKKESKDAKEVVEDLGKILQRDLGANVSGFRLEMQQFEINVKNEFLKDSRN